MDQHTSKLLQECDAGCRMAAESIDQVMQYAKSGDLIELLEAYKHKHEELETEIEKQLTAAGQDEKEPPKFAAAMSWISTQAKMMSGGDEKEIAKIITDGCHMGIQSVCGYINEYSGASELARTLAKELVHIEDDFGREMRAYL